MLNINSFNNIQIYNFAINKTTKKLGPETMYIRTYVYGRKMTGCGVVCFGIRGLINR